VFKNISKYDYPEMIEILIKDLGVLTIEKYPPTIHLIVRQKAG
jgi:hypothetical protein